MPALPTLSPSASRSISRARLLLAALLAAAAALFGAPAAHAGSFTYFACVEPDGSNRQSLDPDYWKALDGLADAPSRPWDGCSAGNGFGANMGTSVGTGGHWWDVNTVAQWTFEYPKSTGLRFDAVTADFTHVNRVGAWGDTGSAHPWSFFAVEDAAEVGPSLIYTCGTWGGCWSGSGPATYWLTPTKRRFTLAVGCGGGDGQCAPAQVNTARNEVVVRSIHFRVVDDAAPQLASPVVGSLRSAGARSGVESLAFTAADAGAGIYRVIVSLGGTEVLRVAPDTNGGRCAAVDVDPAVAYEFMSPQPCATSARAELSVDTRKVANGTQELRVTVLDASGNLQEVLREPVRIDNSAQPGDPGGGGGGGPAGSITLDKRSRGVVGARFDRSTKLTGVVRSPAGAPLAGVAVTADARPQIAGGGWSAATTAPVLTNAAGKFTLTLRPRATQSVRVLAGGAEATLKLAVRARISAAAKSRAIRRGSLLQLRGKVRIDGLPKRGARLAVQSYYYGKWSVVGTVRTKPDGSWRWSYRVKRARGLLPFRARLLTSSDVPASGGTSGVVKVRVR